MELFLAFVDSKISEQPNWWPALVAGGFALVGIAVQWLISRSAANDRKVEREQDKLVRQTEREQDRQLREAERAADIKRADERYSQEHDEIFTVSAYPMTAFPQLAPMMSYPVLLVKITNTGQIPITIDTISAHLRSGDQEFWIANGELSKFEKLPETVPAKKNIQRSPKFSVESLVAELSNDTDPNEEIYLHIDATTAGAKTVSAPPIALRKFLKNHPANRK